MELQFTLKKGFEGMKKDLNEFSPSNWKDIHNFLLKLKEKRDYSEDHKFNLETIRDNGIAFVTFDYGIDGVSIEIQKYAESIESLFDLGTLPSIHFIGGDFFTGADTVIYPRWKRFHLEGSNGWDKWDDGKWFNLLFGSNWNKEGIDPGLQAKNIWEMVISLALNFARYIVENSISLIIPVNICSNPGNIAFNLAVILTGEYLKLRVINSNHDFYWEGGKPPDEREKGEPAGVRDHFFRNYDNREFFLLFEDIYPWNGKRWFQVNINSLQSKELAGKFGFHSEKVLELSTSVTDDFFKDLSGEALLSIRERMAIILSGGEPFITTVNVNKHLENLSKWMKNQHPLVCGISDSIRFDLRERGILYFLQPTRIIARKRIEKDVMLLEQLLFFPPFKEKFSKNESLKIVLHITGPSPIEHQKDLEIVLNAFSGLLSKLPDPFKRRVFLAFSVGTEEHSSFKDKGLKKLTIEEIYRLANIILFPSETEGRGLPIIESGAAGIPIVCSRYYPVEVFTEVTGELMSPDKRIKYIEFPEKEISRELLEEISGLLFHREKRESFIRHNRNAVKKRYGKDKMSRTFGELFKRLGKIK